MRFQLNDEYYSERARESRICLGSFPLSWEQRKLALLIDLVVRKNTNNESSLPLTISAQYGLVDQITYFNNRVASRDVSNYYLVLNGEFAYNKSTSDGFPFGCFLQVLFAESCKLKIQNVALWKIHSFAS